MTILALNGKKKDFPSVVNYASSIAICRMADYKSSYPRISFFIILATARASSQGDSSETYSWLRPSNVLYLLQDLLLCLSGISEPGPHREDSGGRRCWRDLIAAGKKRELIRLRAATWSNISADEKWDLPENIALAYKHKVGGSP